MKFSSSAKSEKRIAWKEEHKTLTLGGEPVLELTLSWPQMAGKKRQGINRCYTRLCQIWKARWEREGYLQACVDLAQQRERSRPFYPWKASLSGQVKLDQGGLLSVAMLAQEVQGDGRTLEYRWGDTWRWEDGAPVTMKELFARKKRWRKQLEEELERAIQDSRHRGVYLDENLEKPLKQWFSMERFALSPEGMEVYYPQCTLAPAVEGALTFLLPLPEGVLLETEEPEKKEA